MSRQQAAARFGIFLLTLVNLSALLSGAVLSLATNGGTSASPTGVVLEAIWVSALTYFAWALASQGKSGRGLLLAALVWPSASGAVMGIGWGVRTFDPVEVRAPDPAFGTMCEAAGATYFASPAVPVRSIAYVWEGDRFPRLNVFRLTSDARVMSSAWVMPKFPSPIVFTEAKCCAHVGPAANGNWPFIRRPNSSEDYFGVSDLSSDALVEYKITEVQAAATESLLHQVELKVADRRDGQLLGSLLYVLDSSNHMVCGTTSAEVMDEAEFVRRAVGLN
ncbi:hypothetical protein [Rhizobacter sp. Root404]|uniref:hypothetical protein n=1 Tax=Rhizobacter sp. Root404 TaxID=1736528 RepID=UPI000AC2DE1C|nr:hypothetical protein [Rhizobacter sp. Root404]